MSIGTPFQIMHTLTYFLRNLLLEFACAWAIFNRIEAICGQIPYLENRVNDGSKVFDKDIS